MKLVPTTKIGQIIVGRLKMSNFMKLEEAIEIVLELAADNVLDDSIIANDPHLSDEQARQKTAIATVEDFFVNNVFSHDE